MKKTTHFYHQLPNQIHFVIIGLLTLTLAGCSTGKQSASTNQTANAAITTKSSNHLQTYYDENKVKVAPADDLFDLLTDYSWYDQKQLLTLQLDGTILTTKLNSTGKNQSIYGEYELISNGQLKVGVYAADDATKIAHTYKFKPIQTTDGLQLTELSQNQPYQEQQWFAVNKVEKETMFD